MGAFWASFVAQGIETGRPLSPIFSYLPWKLLASCYLVQEMGALFLVSEWEEEEERGCSYQLQYLSWTFMWFDAILGLRVNLSKTKAIPVRDDISLETLTLVLGCKIGSLPTSYLGLPLEPPTNPRGCGMQWKKDSGKGRLSRKDNTSPKDGGLGIRSLATFNKALLRKWLWRFANKNEPLWKQIISSKYDLQEGMVLQRSKRPLWGGGLEGHRNEEAFPFLFNLSVNKEGWVAEAWEENEVGGSVDDLLRWKENKNGPFLSSLSIAHSQGASSPPSRLELFGRLGFQLGLASLVGRVQWVMHSSVKRNLLGCHGYFVGKKREKAWRAAPSA
ncbi:hypothetical protein CK203_032114 [Vitis vinifera]|uniref:Uncharacterized protein n=1 Tax=Vitis vinifera TaxID=29760 RepID=A0A438IPT0_VITVI|nr:hypothetical protein CK203_032114 [Vitis vinifera]